MSVKQPDGTYAVVPRPDFAPGGRYAPTPNPLTTLSPPPAAFSVAPAPGDASAPAAPQGRPYDADPGYQMALAQQQLGLSQLDSALKSARERSIIGFGDPTLASQAGFGLDPQAGAFARQNYLAGNATLARLDKQHEQQRQAVINRLAGRGLLNSGDLGYGIGQSDQHYGNQVYDARAALLDYLNGVTQSDLQQRRQLGSGVVGALQQAFQNFTQNPSAWPGYVDPAQPSVNNQGHGSDPVAAAITALTRARPKAKAAPHVAPNNRGGRLGV